MKKFLVLAAAVMTLSMAAQAQIKIGVTAGRSVSNQERNDVSTSKLISNNAFKGYHAGLVADLPLNAHLSLQPQLLYAKKGVKYTGAFGTDAKLTMHSVELPVNLLYKIELPLGKIFAGAGPVVSYGVSGKLVNNGQTKKMYANELNDWSHLDISANALAGIEFNNGFFASVQYQHGFKDLYKTEAVNVKSRSVTLSVGYFLNWKKAKS